ncbi:helix-turn-helix domain-containing protein [Sinorhizobium medicae]|uniref:helix-turn-helix domain-containing protein n=1 Tax=Sinorhizobium medicae TaxID=110321 RepID=UPI000FDB76A4|nr:helix-turn-helix transcriptional regulator [Sinorhizobium medicae]MDX0439151.1 hypothetical protein [Sinorhizobium medicae]MDX0617570.1 hypothetical protein [Sinorhizobium medicae]MDX0654702.1 hypothetical protein [Sinorhizobium medicae]MDX1090911.1 hypothetical protein [Sinorhizobium medicae]MDX1115563.1 hypothetical protein [Sinorhizobium medicae]
MHPLLPLLRAARFLLGSKQGDVDGECGFKKRTVNKIEAGNHVRLPRTAFSLKHYYESKDVEFVDPVDGHGAGVRWRTAGPVDPVRSHLFRAARGLADLSQEKVAIQAGIDESFIARLERDELKQINEEWLQCYEAFLKAENVEITPPSTSFGAGVRWIAHREQALASEHDHVR